MLLKHILATISKRIFKLSSSKIHKLGAGHLQGGKLMNQAYI